MFNVLNFIVGVLVCVLYCQSVMAEIYQWRDEKGKLHISDKAPETIKSETIDIDELIKKTEGIRFSKSNKKVAGDTGSLGREKNQQPRRLPLKKVNERDSYKLNVLAKKCRKSGRDKCFQKKDETICVLRYGVPCEAIHFWKARVKTRHELRTGQRKATPYYILSHRPRSLIAFHLDKKIPTHKNINKKNIRCLERSGFFCDELSDLSVCLAVYDMRCDMLRRWKADAIKICKRSNGVACESLAYLAKQRPISVAEFNNTTLVRGGYDALFREYGIEKKDPKQYKKIQSLIDRFGGQ